MSKHTPGPWSFFRGLGTGNFYVESNIPGITANQQFLVKIGESEGNARLIAAAPEMLEALKDAHALILEYMPEYPSRDFNSRLNTIYKVIKKAEGA